MTQATTSSFQPRISRGTRTLIGAGIGLLAISLLVFPFNHPDPAWGKLWMIRPLIVVPLAGATGGFCNYFLMHLHAQGKMNKIVAIILSLIIFLFGLWIGTILGLAGTLWN